MRSSVYTPGAGHRPAVLAGRQVLMRDFELMLNDAGARGRVRARDLILVGPRGVGKTALLSAFADVARAQGVEVVGLQAVVGQAGLIESLMHRARTLASAGEGPWRRVKAAFDRVAGVDVSVAGFGVGLSTREADTRPGAGAGFGARESTFDAGVLADALAALSDEIRADNPNGGLLITVDEMQVASGPDLALLAAALHRLNVEHPDANVLFAGCGLPVTTESLHRAGVTHPDRLFSLEDVPLTLTPDDARYALVEPARQVAVTWEPEAVDRIIQLTNGYPAHLQLFADAAWTAAPGPGRVTLADVEASLPGVGAGLERRTLGPRWDRITDRQLEFVAALAVHEGRAPMALVAATLGKAPQEVSWLRDELIKQGDIYAPRRGQIAMAIPLFSSYVLTRYPQETQQRGTGLLSLEQMRRNAEPASPPPTGPVGPPGPPTPVGPTRGTPPSPPRAVSQGEQERGLPPSPAGGSAPRR